MKIQAFIFITSILLLISFVHESEQFGGVFKIPPRAPPGWKRQLNFKVCGMKRSFCTYLGVSQGFHAIDTEPDGSKTSRPFTI